MLGKRYLVLLTPHNTCCLIVNLYTFATFTNAPTAMEMLCSKVTGRLVTTHNIGPTRFLRFVTCFKGCLRLSSSKSGHSKVGIDGNCINTGLHIDTAT